MEVLCLVSRRNRACLLHDRHPALQALRHRIDYRNDHLIVGRYLEGLCGRAFSRVRCYPSPMAWQEVARNLASREVKVYERIQDGMLTVTQCNHRFTVGAFFGLDDHIDGRVHALLAVAPDGDILIRP